MSKMSKLNKILIGLVVVLLLVLGAIVYWQKIGFEKPYWAVYTNTGDLYFGKLSHFPKLSLTDVWFLQRNAQDTKNPVSLARFDGIFWGPENRIFLDEKNVVWKAKLRDDSQVVKYIKNPQSAESQQGIQSQQPNQPAKSDESNSQPKSE